MLSICGPLANRVKLYIEFAKKNLEMATNQDFKTFINLLFEQLIPQFCAKNIENESQLTQLHNLMFLFTYKIQQVFQARVIHQIID